MDKAPASPLAGSTLVGRLRKGLASSVISQLVAAANSLLLVPLFLRAWGTDEYGRWLTLSAFVSYVTLLDFGGQSYFGNMLAIAFVTGKEEEFRQRLSEGVSLFAAICGCIAVIIIILLIWNPVKIPWMSRYLIPEERIIIGCLGISYLLSIVGGVYNTPYRATGLYARGTMIGNLTRIGGFVILATALYFHIRPSGYAMIFLVSVMATGLILVWDIRRCIPVCRNIQIGITAAKKGKVHFKGSLYFWLMSLAQMMNQEGIILVLSATCSPAAVALYSTHRAIAGLVRYPSAFVQSPLWAELSFLWGKGRYDELSRILLFTIKLIVLASIVMVVAILIGVPFVYPIWTGRLLHLHMLLLVILLTQAVMMAGWSTTGWVLLTANRHQQLAIWSLANAVLTIAGALILVKPLGFLGVALAALLSDLACGALISPRLAGKFLGVRARQFYFAFLRIIIISSPLIISIFLLSIFLEGWDLFISSSLLALLLIYPILLLTLGKEDIAKIWQICTTWSS